MLVQVEDTKKFHTEDPQVAAKLKEQPSSAGDLRTSQPLPHFPDDDKIDDDDEIDDDDVSYSKQQLAAKPKEQFSSSDKLFTSPSLFGSLDDDTCWMLADDVRCVLYCSYVAKCILCCKHMVCIIPI